MKAIITLILIGISLSMDAFSLSLALGITCNNKKNKIILSLIVGIYHFIMPLLGFVLSSILTNINLISIDIIAFIILLYVGLELIISNTNEDFTLNTLGYLLFGLSVSIDSLTIGISLKAITNNIVLAPTIFMISSLTFTYIGLNIGSTIGTYLKKYSKIFGGTILIIISLIILINH